jgi:S1-C subfamily serine protease
MNDDPSSSENEPTEPAATPPTPPAHPSASEEPTLSTATPPPTPTHTPPASASEEPTMAMSAAPQSAAGTATPAGAPLQAAEGSAPPASRIGRAARASALGRPRWQWLAVLAAIVVGAILMGVAIGYGVWGGSSVRMVFPGQHGSSSHFGMPFDNNNGGQNGNGYVVPNGNGNDNGMPYGFGGSGQNGSGSSGSGSSGSGSTGAGAPTNISQIASGVNPGLVDLTVTLAYQNGTAAATGIVLTSTGEVLTNNHVVEGASSISATDVGNGQTYKATVVGYDRSRDIAVLQLSGASGLQTAPVGDSSTVSVGDGVVAIGNAGGTGGTPSAAGGSVIALDQQIVADGAGGAESLSGLIEVNADVQPGDSGGPLVDRSGKVVGVDTAASARFAFRGDGGRGYAVPINQALAVVKQIESGSSSGTVHVGPTAFLGVALTPQAQGGSSPGSQNGTATAGAVVAGVLPGTPATKAGLKAGDVITSLDGQRVDSASTLTSLVGRHQPGDRVQVIWVDTSGTRHTATVTLATGPAA